MTALEKTRKATGSGFRVGNVSRRIGLAVILAGVLAMMLVLASVSGG